MKFFCHFGLEAFSNAYLVGPDEGGEAVLIDPGDFDETLLAMIEKNRLDLRHILLTHAHESHMRGVPTALKIYDATVYGVVPLPRVERHRTIEDGEELELGGDHVIDLELAARDELLDLVHHLFDNGLFGYLANLDGIRPTFHAGCSIGSAMVESTLF